MYDRAAINREVVQSASDAETLTLSLRHNPDDARPATQAKIVLGHGTDVVTGNHNFAFQFVIERERPVGHTPVLVPPGREAQRLREGGAVLGSFR